MMRYIKPYKLFENSKNISEDDIKDILLELEDTNKVDINYPKPYYYDEKSFPLAKNMIIISIKESLSWEKNIYDTIIRLINYLGDNMLGLTFSVDDYRISFTMDDKGDNYIGNLNINTFGDSIKKIEFIYKFNSDCQKISIGNFKKSDKTYKSIINMTGADISAVNSILEPYKRYEKDNQHSIMFGKDNPDYKRPNDIFSSGFIWYLKDNKCESIYINKLNNGFFVISFKIGISIHAYMVKGLELLIGVIKDYIIYR